MVLGGGGETLIKCSFFKQYSGKPILKSRFAETLTTY